VNLGVDSAITVPSPDGVVTVYEEADKLFQIKNRPIGIATCGLGTIAGRTVGSYIREFQINDPKNVIQGAADVKLVVEELRFFHEVYTNNVAPMLEKQTGNPLEQIPSDRMPIIGFVVGCTSCFGTDGRGNWLSNLGPAFERDTNRSHSATSRDTCPRLCA